MAKENIIRTEHSPRLGKIEVVEDTSARLAAAFNGSELLWAGPTDYVQQQVDEHMAWAESHVRHMGQRVA